jgi:putative ABC transport system permease protein
LTSNAKSKRALKVHSQDDVMRRDASKRITSGSHRFTFRAVVLGAGWQDLQFAIRRLRHQRAFAALVVVMLALGVGAPTAMFSAVDAALLRPLPFKDASQLVLLPSVPVPSTHESRVGRPAAGAGLTWDNVRAMPGLISGIAAYYATTANLFDPSRPARVNVGHVTAEFFHVLGMEPIDGRVFADAEAHVGGPRLAILSYSFWRAHFGGRGMIDSVLSLDGNTFTVIGVMPRRFNFPDKSDLWVAMPVPVPPQAVNFSRGLPPSRHTIARLKRGVTLASASERLLALRRSRNESPVFAAGRGGAEQLPLQGHIVVPLQQSLASNGGKTLLILLGATGLLTLIACTNVASLYLTQTVVRRRELALRAALGASRTRVVRQLLTEGMVLAIVGTAIGLVLAPATFGLLTKLMPPALASLAPPRLDVAVGAFAACLALATGIGSGLWPALMMSRSDVADLARVSGAPAMSREARGFVRHGLLAAELALTLMLLIGAELMLKSLQRLTSVDTGFDTAHVVSVKLDFGTPPPLIAVRRQRLSEILDQTTATPGVMAAGATGGLPVDAPTALGLGITAEGVPERAENERARTATYLSVTGGYFEAMGIRLLAGRTFGAADDSAAGSAGAVIINQALADSLWPGMVPISRWISWDGRTERLTVVGVVANVRFFALDRAPGPQVYMPLEAAPPSSMALVVRGALPSEALLGSLRRAIRAVDPSQPVYEARTMDDIVRESIAAPRNETTLIGTFGIFALVLAVVGVYGVIQYSVAQRQSEFGIRAALGATGKDLALLASREVLWAGAFGLLVGIGAAWAGARVIQSLTYGVGVHDVPTYVFATMVLIVPAAAATLLPIRRAARTNPLDVIRRS